MLSDRAKTSCCGMGNTHCPGVGLPSSALGNPWGEYYWETVLGSVTRVWSPECLKGDPEAIATRSCLGSGWRALEAADLLLLLLLSSSSGRTRCAAQPPMPSATCPRSAAAPRPPAPLTCTCRTGTTAGVALATATGDAASPQTCSAGSSTGEVTGCAGGTAQGQG